MTMKDDYLWEPSGTPDPDVERLEQVLGRLRTKAPAPRVRLPPSPPGGFGETRKPDTTYIDGERAVSYVGLRFLGPALAAAAAIVLMVGFTWQTAAPTAA